MQLFARPICDATLLPGVRRRAERGVPGTDDARGVGGADRGRGANPDAQAEVGESVRGDSSESAGDPGGCIGKRLRSGRRATREKERSSKRQREATSEAFHRVAQSESKSKEPSQTGRSRRRGRLPGQTPGPDGAAFDLWMFCRARWPWAPRDDDAANAALVAEPVAAARIAPAWREVSVSISTSAGDVWPPSPPVPRARPRAPRRRAKPSRAIHSTATFTVSRPCRPTSTATDCSASICALLSCYVLGFYGVMAILLACFGTLTDFDAQSANVQNGARDAARKRGS